MKERYHDKLIALVYHNRDDLATEDGTEYIKYIKPAHPQAAIDRVQYPETTKIPISRGDWGRTVAYRMEAPTKFSVEVEAAYDAPDRDMKLTAKIGVKGEADDAFRINVVVAEDHIRRKQKYSRKPYKEIEEYYHSHVVRDMITGPFGKPLDLTAKVNGGTISVPFTFNIKPEFIDRNCHVVVFIHKDLGDGFGPVMQAEEIHIADFMPQEKK